jgi:predicted metal-dependent hydrolase
MKVEYDTRLIKGIDEFNHGLFFECHETLEEIWLEEHGKDRDFYQGIIQIAAGYLKWEQGVLSGAIKLWKSGLKKLSVYGSAHLGVDLGPFVRRVEENLSKVERAREKGEDSAALTVPVLSLSR